MDVSGSSPLARGTPADLLSRERLPRFIPARAGNTCTAASRRPRSTVHPRSRGEHGLGLRGRLEPVRFIPARAGNTDVFEAASIVDTVHPRSRGEHAGRGRPRGSCGRFIPARAGNTTFPRPSRADTSGSSPLARGTHPHGQIARQPRRFIPARAGNTDRGRESRHLRPVHPRSRGEHMPPIAREKLQGGSSPLARGTPGTVFVVNDNDRFIPARAGNTGRRRRRPGASPVHPRSRGEHLHESASGCVPPGSSPLARGTPARAPVDGGRKRFIPARAGNTDRGCCGSRGTTVHPRSRGEHALSSRSGRAWPGSSPLARGTRANRFA